LTHRLNRDSNVPLYKQLKKGLIEYIQNHLHPGEVMPTESEIEEMYEVSRITVRKAIESLEAEGIVVKQQGRGTFVKSTEIIQKVGSVTSWTEEMKRKGKKTETVGLEVKEIVPSKRLIHELQLNKGETVICIKRIRCVDGEPLAIMVNYLSGRQLPDFVKIGLQGESLYEVLKNRYGIEIERATEWVRAREATDLEAAALQIPPYSAVLSLRRFSYVDQIPFEIVEMVVRADRYQYIIELSGDSKRKVIDDDIGEN
jgi:GntR family transcriptional regulator